jgi:hypothetical protein
MAGSIALSLTQQFDNLGNVLSGGQLFFIQAGTVGTPQNAFQDVGLTLPWSNPYTLTANGRVPLLYFADGYVKVRITDRLGAPIFTQDNIPVTGFSSGGGGGGGTIDPTTVLQTGQLIAMYGTGILTGFTRANGRTIGNASSGASELGAASAQSLFIFLYTVDPNLVVAPGGRSGNALNDFNANKTIALPDYRGRALAGLDDMGNSAAGRLTAAYFGTAATVLGAAGGSEKNLIGQNNFPAIALSVTGTFAGLTDTVHPVINAATGSPFSSSPSGGPSVSLSNTAGVVASQVSASGSITGSAATGGGAVPLPVASPMMLATIYLKL